jgi:hypothetical protein
MGEPERIGSVVQSLETLAQLATDDASFGPPAVYAAIVAVADEIGQAGIAKDRNNQQQGFKFRGVDDVMNTFSPLLVKHRLFVIPTVEERVITERVSAKGNPLFFTHVKVRFRVICAVDGSYIEGAMFGEGMDSADKSSNKAVAVAYKYFFFQTFCVPTEGMGEDPDGTTHTLAPVPPMDRLRALLQSKGIATAKVCAHYSVETLDDLSAAQIEEAIQRAQQR